MRLERIKSGKSTKRIHSNFLRNAVKRTLQIQSKYKMYSLELPENDAETDASNTVSEFVRDAMIHNVADGRGCRQIMSNVQLRGAYLLLIFQPVGASSLLAEHTGAISVGIRGISQLSKIFR